MRRLAEIRRRAARATEPAERWLALHQEAIKAELPLWWAWGQVLMDAEENERVD
jgi:hypothetical protein